MILSVPDDAITHYRQNTSSRRLRASASRLRLSRPSTRARNDVPAATGGPRAAVTAHRADDARRARLRRRFRARAPASDARRASARAPDETARLRSHLCASADDRALHSLDGCDDASDAPYVVVKRVDAHDVGALGDVLLSLGASSVSTIDADAGTEDEHEIFSANTFEELASDKTKARVWAKCHVTAYFEDHARARAGIEAAEEILGISLEASYAESKSNDWVQAVKDSFTPTKIADGLYIVPDWCKDVDANAVNIALEPGIAFGTGEHPTTRLCLRWLQQTLARRGKTELVVDFGCGSGVLAIGALVMGADRAVGVDLAKQAVQSSIDNAKLNGVEDRLTTHLGDGRDPGTPGANGQADVVVANILIGPVLELEPLFAGVL